MVNPPTVHAGYWALPSNKSSNSYHRYADTSSPTLCGRWPAGSHTHEKDSRLTIVGHMDCRKCQELFRAQLAELDKQDRWVSTYSAHKAWMQQHRVYHSKSTFRRRAEKAGVRYWMGTLLWDGYWWHAGDLKTLMCIIAPHSQSDSIGERPVPAILI